MKVLSNKILLKSNPKNNKYIYKKRNYYTYITEEIPTPLIYCLQSLQEQACCTHLRISILNLLRELGYFILVGIISQILGPK